MSTSMQVRSIPYWESVICVSVISSHYSLWYSHRGALLFRAALNPFPAWPLFVFGIGPTQVVGLVKLHELWTCPLPRSLWITSFPSSVSNHTSWYHAQTCWGYTQSQCPCHWKRCYTAAVLILSAPEELHLSLVSPWTQLLQCNHPANSLSIEWSIQKLPVFSV